MHQESQMRNSYEVQHAEILPISQANYHIHIQRLQNSTDEQERQNINRLLKNYLQDTHNIPPQDAKKIQNSSHAYQAQSSFSVTP